MFLVSQIRKSIFDSFGTCSKIKKFLKHFKTYKAKLLYVHLKLDIKQSEIQEIK